jgi:hypothetical protein
MKTYHVSRREFYASLSCVWAYIAFAFLRTLDQNHAAAGDWSNWALLAGSLSTAVIYLYQSKKSPKVGLHASD